MPEKSSNEAFDSEDGVEFTIEDVGSADDVTEDADSDDVVDCEELLDVAVEFCVEEDGVSPFLSE